MRHAWIAFLLLFSAVAVAAPGDFPHRDGANHHLGDDSFVAAFGRAPTPGDSEAVRMHTHLAYVRAWLTARPATSPAREGRRAELLGYLDDYIAKGVTPRNTYVARRSPVFIDRDGNICAVGYLIERSVGRALPETIARLHRTAYLEEIAAAMPEVGAWVESSGFTLDELASIQPGYMGPEVMHIQGFSKEQAKDGAYSESRDGTLLVGAFAKRQMTGAWTRTLIGPKDAGKVIGAGTFKNGAGTWTAVRQDGTRMAAGPFRKSRAEGTWTFYHRSGRVAAVGAMHGGRRDGAWTFFYDAEGRTKLATGKFARGETVGTWKHFDPAGKLVATSMGRAWGDNLLLDIAPGTDGVRRTIHQGIPAESSRMETLAHRKDRVYILDRTDLFDAAGHQLARVGRGWEARACTWTAKEKKLAKAGQVAKLHMSLWSRRMQADSSAPPPCAATGTPVEAARAARIDALLASVGQPHAPIPVIATFADPSPVAEDEVASEPSEPDPGAPTPIVADDPADMTTYLADNMTWYLEWPHVDQPFVAVYASLPGAHVDPADVN